MSALIERLRRNREFKVEAGGHVFIVRRPTDHDWAEMIGDFNARNLIRYVVGWERVTELDLIAGGAGHPVPFDAATAEEWLADRPDLLLPVTTRIVESYREHAQRRDAERKN